MCHLQGVARKQRRCQQCRQQHQHRRLRLRRLYLAGPSTYDGARGRARQDLFFCTRVSWQTLITHMQVVDTIMFVCTPIHKSHRDIIQEIRMVPCFTVSNIRTLVPWTRITTKMPHVPCVNGKMVEPSMWNGVVQSTVTILRLLLFVRIRLTHSFTMVSS